MLHGKVEQVVQYVPILELGDGQTVKGEPCATQQEAQAEVDKALAGIRERAERQRKTAAALGAIALVLLSSLPSWAYRGSGRAYNPPDVGAPKTSIGTGSR